MEEKKIAKTN